MPELKTQKKGSRKINTITQERPATPLDNSRVKKEGVVVRIDEVAVQLKVNALGGS